VADFIDIIFWFCHEVVDSYWKAQRFYFSYFTASLRSGFGLLYTFLNSNSSSDADNLTCGTTSYWMQEWNLY
jgi:hypothetical protein